MKLNLLKKISKFCVFYGKAGIKDFLNYDLLILDTQTLNPEDCKKLHEKKKLIIYYLSLGEASPRLLDTGAIKESWILGRNKIWNSAVMDPRSGWKEHILNVQIPDILVSDPLVSGLFFDTVDMTALYPQTSRALAELIKTIRETWPQLLLIQNRGLVELPSMGMSLAQATGSYLDGIMAESLFSTYDFTDRKFFIPTGTEEVIRTMKETAAEFNLAAFSLDYCDPADRKTIKAVRKKSESWNFKSYIAGSVFLHEWESFTGK
jgi:hypothetical protein